MSDSFFKNLLSYIPGWLGFLGLILVGTAMVLNGFIEPFGALDYRNKIGFVTFGFCALAIGSASWIMGGTSQIKGRAGKVGIKVRIQDLPWWGYLVDGGILAAAIAVYLILTS